MFEHNTITVRCAWQSSAQRAGQSVRSSHLRQDTVCFEVASPLQRPIANSAQMTILSVYAVGVKIRKKTYHTDQYALKFQLAEQVKAEDSQRAEVKVKKTEAAYTCMNQSIKTFYCNQNITNMSANVK